MKEVLYNYDIFPKVFLTNEEQNITIKPLGAHADFDPSITYTVLVRESAVSEERHFEGLPCTRRFEKKCEIDGTIRLSLSCANEGMYQIQLFKPEEKKRFCELRVYALNHDMAGRFPFRGDLHLHSIRSDGDEDPGYVAANYRGHGYDFMALTDHRRYYPSLEARKKMGISRDDTSPITDLLVACGEEVQIPLTDIHYINFGGKYSLNALIDGNCNQELNGDDPFARSLDGNCPAVMPREDYEKDIRERAKSVDRENEAERLAYAALEWTYEHIKDANALGIFVHPFWYCSTCHVSEDFTRYIYEHKPFDAFEVLGGETYYQQNGLQSILYYEEKAKGFESAVVGSTDSHNSTEYNNKALVCSTIAFAKANKTSELVSAIKDKYSVAVDTLSKEYRLVGSFRFAKYGAFLMDEYYPLHDQLCAVEGLYLRRYLAGDAKAPVILATLKGQVQQLQEKYFNI